MRKRACVIALLALAEIAALYLLGGVWLWLLSVDRTLSSFFTMWATLEVHVLLAPWVAGIVALQAMLMLPVRKPIARTEGRGSVLCSLAAAGVATALLVSAAAWAILEAARAWEEFTKLPYAGWAILGMIASSWLLATPLLIAYGRRKNRELLVSRVAGVLFIGSMIESLAIIPLDVMVRRRTDCYCGTGSFLALTATGTVGLMTMGPAFLAPLLMRRRLRWWGNRCEACGYDMTGNRDADRCPECGAGWRADHAAAK